MDTHHRLDLFSDIFAQLGFNGFGRHAVSPISRDKIDHDTEVQGQLLPERTEMSGLEHQYPIAGRQSVYNSGLPCPGPTGWKDENLALSRLKHSFHTLQTIMTELGKLLTTVINGRPIDGADHAIRHIGRTRDLKKVSAGEVLAVHGGVLAVAVGGSVRVARMGLMGPMGTI